jgi:aspartyl-tRNA(Asn)/glutamyl-tRNA(Gln) amidotransferase subunit A
MGAPWNPWDPNVHRVPGGSSSGSAVAVAAGLASAAIGSDTGGSVRIPAAFTGITGLKVTYGRVSLHGAALLSWTLDTIGPMARTVEDCAMLFDAIAGPDARDPATLHQPAPSPLRHWPEKLRGVCVAMPPADQLPAFTHPAVIAAWQDVAKVLAEAGAEVVEARFPEWFFELAAKVGGVIIATEALTLHKDWIESTDHPIGEGVRTRILNGRKLSAAEYAGTLRQMHERRRAFTDWFEPYDALLLPTVAVPAPALAEIDEQAPIPSYLTRPVNYLGLCGLSIPAGSHEGLPIGVQLIGKPYDEHRILQIGRACERIIGWNCTPMPG